MLNNSTTTNCTAADWSMSHYIVCVSREKFAPNYVAFHQNSFDHLFIIIPVKDNILAEN